MSYTPVSSNTFLAYALDILPDPLQASPTTGNTVYAALTFSISNNSTTAVSLSKLQFQLPIGTLAQDLTASSTAIICSASPAAAWDISIDANGLCTATPSSGTPISVTTDGIIMQVYNVAVNQQTGTVSITVTETASNSGGAPTNQLATFNVAKFPYGFYFTNFAANAAQVADLGTVTLTWQGSDMAAYTLMYAGTSVDVTNDRTWTSPPLSNDTTFILTASVVSLGTTVTSTLSTTVIVSNPDVTATSLAVSGNTSLQGTLGVNGAVNANNVLTVGGATTLNSTLSVTGASTLSSVTVNGALNASGGITTSQLISSGATVNGNASIAGTLSLTSLQAIGTPQLIYSGNTAYGNSFTAPTDGFACGYVTGPTPNNTLALVYLWASSNGASTSASGGNSCVAFSWDGSSGTSWMNNVSGSFCLPVAKGNSFTVSGGYPSNNAVNPNYSLYWIPIGSGTVSLAAPLATLEHKIPEVPEFSFITNKNKYTHEPAVNGLMNVLSEIFGDKLSADLKVKLHDAVKELVYNEGKETISGTMGAADKPSPKKKK